MSKWTKTVTRMPWDAGGKAFLLHDISPKTPQEIDKVMQSVPRFKEMYSKYPAVQFTDFILNVYKLVPPFSAGKPHDVVHYVLLASFNISNTTRDGTYYEIKETSVYKCNSKGKILHEEEIYITHKHHDAKDVLIDMGAKYEIMPTMKPETTKHFADILGTL